MKGIKIAILAGGLATRLRPITEKIPKSLIDINGKPFLWHQIKLLKKQGIDHLVICTGYLGELIEEYFGSGKDFGVNIEYSHDGKTLLGTGGALKKALPLLGDEFFVMYGDSYLEADYREIYSFYENNKENRSGLMTVYKNKDAFDKSNVVFKNKEIVVYDKKNKHEEMLYIDWGLGIFNKAAFEKFSQQDTFDLAELYRDLVQKKALLGYEVKNRFFEIGSVSGIEELREKLR